MSAHHRTPEYLKFSRRIKPLLAAQLPMGCPRCGHPMTKAMYSARQLDLGHIIPGVDSPENVRLEHSKCNRSAGGKAGTARQAATRRQDKRLGGW